MKFFEKLFFLFIASCFIYSPNALACKYTVRDIGFTDLGSSAYQLYFYVDAGTPQDIINSFERFAYASLLESNVETHTIHVQQQKNHQALAFLNAQKRSLPLVILVDERGRTINLPLNLTNGDVKQNIWQTVESAVSSHLRQKIVDLVTTTFGVVLLIEGTDNTANDLAVSRIDKAVDDISQIQRIMPKPVKGRPQVVKLSRKDFLQEKVLLWSLDINTENITGPQVAVLFGRGRCIGSTLSGKDITRENIFGLLAIIGADCECGLDKSIMLGKMIPLRWEKHVQTVLVSSLGFDVENPMIKAEMGQILSIAPTKQGKNPLTAYQEGIVRFDSVMSVPTVSSNQFRPVSSNSSLANGFSWLSVGFLTGAGLIIVILFFSAVIFFKVKK